MLLWVLLLYCTPSSRTCLLHGTPGIGQQLSQRQTRRKADPFSVRASRERRELLYVSDETLMWSACLLMLELFPSKEAAERDICVISADMDLCGWMRLCPSPLSPSIQDTFACLTTLKNNLHPKTWNNYNLYTHFTQGTLLYIFF